MDGRRIIAMRITRFAFVVIALGIAASASSQTERLLLVEVSDAPTTGLVPAQAPYSDGGLVVPARPVRPGVTPLVSEFRIRAWIEAEVAGLGGSLRVVVSAIRAQEREQQIASVVVSPNQSVEIAATEKFNARRITLRAISPNSTPRPMVRRFAAPPLPLPGSAPKYRIEIYRGDVPTDPAMRPWQPPPRQSR